MNESRLPLMDDQTEPFGFEIEAGSVELAGHSKRMSVLCALLGSAYGFSESEVRLFCETASFPKTTML